MYISGGWVKKWLNSVHVVVECPHVIAATLNSGNRYVKIEKHTKGPWAAAVPS